MREIVALKTLRDSKTGKIYEPCSVLKVDDEKADYLIEKQSAIDFFEFTDSVFKNHIEKLKTLPFKPDAGASQLIKQADKAYQERRIKDWLRILRQIEAELS